MSTMSRFDAIRRTLDLCPEIVADSDVLRRLRDGISLDIGDAFAEGARLAEKSSQLSTRNMLMGDADDLAVLAELHRVGAAISALRISFAVTPTEIEALAEDASERVALMTHGASAVVFDVRRQPMTEEALLAAVALGPAGYAGDVVFESPARLRELGARLGGVERVTLQGWADQRETEEYDHAHRPGL